MNVKADREFIINELNRSAEEEGFDSKAEATGKALVTANGILWHEVVDTESRTTFLATTSIPVDMGNSFMEKIFTVSDEEEEAAQVDHTEAFR